MPEPATAWSSLEAKAVSGTLSSSLLPDLCRGQGTRAGAANTAIKPRDVPRVRSQLSLGTAAIRFTHLQAIPGPGVIIA